MGASDDAIERYAAKQVGIDVSEWIERDPQAKPGTPHPMEGYRQARAKHPFDRHPLDILHGLSILTNRQVGAGWFLIRLRNSALMRLDVSRMGEVLKDKSAAGIPDGAPVTDGDYIYILQHRLEAVHREFVERICWGYLDRAITDAWVEDHKPAIVKAFDALLAIYIDIYPKAD